MPITNAEAIRFCDEKARPVATTLLKAYQQAKQVLTEWNAENYGGTTIPIAGGTVRDTSSPDGDAGEGGDGRKVITGNDVHGVMVRLSEMVSDFEENNNAKLNTVLTVSQNPL